MIESYADRVEAGRVLAETLQEQYGHRQDVVVLALPRGGVPVAMQVAAALQAPLDLVIVRKLGVPGHEELAMGALASGNARVINRDIVRSLGLDEQTIDAVTQRERRELLRREHAYRGTRPLPALAGRCVILIDDGLATGASMHAAVEALRLLQPARIVVAVPVAPPETVEQLRPLVDELVCPLQPEDFGGVGRWYENFEQVGDDEVRQILDEAWKRTSVGRM